MRSRQPALFPRPLLVLVELATLFVATLLVSATVHAAQREVISDQGEDTVASRRSVPTLPRCGEADVPLTATLLRFHEDSSIRTRIDLNALDLEQYASLGVQVAREDGLGYFPVGPSFAESAHLRSLTPGGCFDRVFSQLKPGRTYDICLIGLNADFTSTGLFACVSVTTELKKPETALLITNSNSRSLRRTIDNWMRHVKAANPDLTIRHVKVPSRISVRRLWDLIRTHYVKSNLTTVILGSPGLPLPVVDNFGAEVAYSGVYTSLSRKFMADDGFLNPTNPLREVSIATWNAPRASIERYLRRVIDFYRGETRYDRRLLAANAMIPSESPLAAGDFADARYLAGNIDFVGDITAYFDETQGTLWRDRYLELLDGYSYEMVLLNAHGAPDFHYPCVSAGCIDAPLIRGASPTTQFLVAVSCSIGNLGGLDTPMTAYIFESRSLAGLAAEVTFFSNGSELLFIKSRLEEGIAIGAAGRRFGLTVFGDPFLRLDD